MTESPPTQRQLVKLAVLIHDRLSQTPESNPDRHLPDYAWRCAQREHQRLQLACRKGWRHAQSVQYERLRQYLQMLERDLLEAISRFQVPPTMNIASPREIFNDLRALYDEFDQVTYEAKHSLLSVTTEPITLEGLFLGPFRIELDLRKLLPHPYYLVIAEEPQRPERNDSVTHPHVEGDRLCEGDGTMMLRAAMRSGRLMDFFHIINNLLRTYNSASPYVAISEWGGSVCTECDYSLDSDDGCSCERCEATLCSECSRCCCNCSETICTSCSRVCSGCDEDVCRGCVKECRDCTEIFCSSCLQDDERCRTCHEAFQEQTENEATDTDVLTDRVGEAAVLAGPG